MSELTVSIIVHQNFGYIQRALETLFAGTSCSMTVYVVINQGAREDIERLRTTFPQVHLVENDHPQGFAANHNQIMRLAQSDFVALLNDDIEIHLGALDRMCDYLKLHPQVGLAGASLINSDGTPQVSVYSDPRLPLTLYKISGVSRITAEGTRLRSLLQRLKIIRLSSWVEQMEDREVNVVKGVAMVVRRTAYEQVGLMDEATRMYGEEIDWHLRFRKGGWIVAYIATAKVTHYGVGQRISCKTLVDDRISLLNYYLKHKPKWQAAVLRIAIFTTHSFGAMVCLPFNPEWAQAYWQTALMTARWQQRTDSSFEKAY